MSKSEQITETLGKVFSLVSHLPHVKRAPIEGERLYKLVNGCFIEGESLPDWIKEIPLENAAETTIQVLQNINLDKMKFRSLDVAYDTNTEDETPFEDTQWRICLQLYGPSLFEVFQSEEAVEAHEKET